ncbi:unnamed protein product [Paramecium sonneborni]|uniref:Uncharacterized protein n=1 Tax=Paramecium sonneborni TaxID=65129 RepID=A0A8S1RPD7_9CILI|nr:unnamed protein product [Paramecium sonneborni]
MRIVGGKPFQICECNQTFKDKHTSGLSVNSEQLQIINSVIVNVQKETKEQMDKWARRTQKKQEREIIQRPFKINRKLFEKLQFIMELLEWSKQITNWKSKQLNQAELSHETLEIDIQRSKLKSRIEIKGINQRNEKESRCIILMKTDKREAIAGQGFANVKEYNQIQSQLKWLSKHAKMTWLIRQQMQILKTQDNKVWKQHKVSICMKAILLDQRQYIKNVDVTIVLGRQYRKQARSVSALEKQYFTLDFELHSQKLIEFSYDLNHQQTFYLPDYITQMQRVQIYLELLERVEIVDQEKTILAQKDLEMMGEQNIGKMINDQITKESCCFIYSWILGIKMTK